MATKGFKVTSPVGGVTTGNTFYADNGNAEAADGGSGAASPDWGTEPEKPFRTLDYAIGQCTANNGDIINIMPGHTETLNSSAALILDVAGITINGIGTGSLRPVFNVSTSGANEARIGITGDGTIVRNLIFRANSTSVGSSNVGIYIGASDVVIDGCRFDHNSTLSYFANTIEVPAGVSRVTIKNNTFFNVGTTAQAQKAIDISGTASHIDLSIVGNRFQGNWSGAGVIASSTDCTYYNFLISDNYIANNSTIAADRCISLPSTANLNGGSAGAVINNRFISGSSGTSAQLCALGAFRGVGNIFNSSTGTLFNARGIASS